MADLLDRLDKEYKSEIKKFKLEKPIVDYSEVYKQVVFERKAVRNGKEKDLFMFQNSLTHLRKRGCARHPRPNEAFGLLCSHLEGDLSVKNVAKDMLTSYGEWFSLAIKYQNNILHCYVDPELEFGGKQNMYNLKSYGSEILFPLSELEESTDIGIKDLHAKNPDFVEFIWSRSFCKLPLDIQKNARFYLYAAESVWPVGRNGYYGRYGIFCDCYNRASRGIIEKK